jgi:queuosine biosynthesis protein QueC
MKRALVVLSGGQDSTTCLAWAKKHFDEVHAITFDYGQRHAIEIDAAISVANIIGVASHEIIKVPGVLTGRSFLTDQNAQVEEFADFDAMEHHNAFKANKLDSSFVPMRNALFLNIAANRAYVLQADVIVTGVTAADFAEFANISWDWLGGYLDACAEEAKLSDFIFCPNNDPEFIRRLKSWLLKEVPTCQLLPARDGLSIGVAEIAEKLLNHTYNRIPEHKPNERPLTSAYIAGFWEGCGKLYGTFGPCGSDTSVGPKMALTFKHFNSNILSSIHAAMGNTGAQYPEDGIMKLLLPIPSLTNGLLTAFRKNLCCLGSFAKLTQVLHSLGQLAGGFNPPYPDCSPDFIFSFNRQLDEALRVPGLRVPEVIAPLMFLSKAQSVQLALRLPQCQQALAYSHTSYDGMYPPVGRNHANLLRAKGFEDAGVPDPLVMRAWNEGLMELPLTSNYDSYRPVTTEGV